MPLVLRDRTYADSALLVMAIINRTPDSFYDKGATYDDAAALAAVDRAVRDGADIVDIGGVKAGPGAVVSEAEEIARVVPFVRAVRDRHAELVISVDTWRSGVAEACLAAGADLLNDAWGGVDERIFEVTADSQVVWEYINPYFHAESGRPGINNWVFRAFRYTPEEIERARRA